MRYLYCIFSLAIEFAVIIKDIAGGTSKILKTAAVEDDPQRRKPDITKAREILNWSPKVKNIYFLHIVK